MRVFKWPSMEIILDEANAHNSVKDLDFRLTVIAPSLEFELVIPPPPSSPKKKKVEKS